MQLWMSLFCDLYCLRCGLDAAVWAPPAANGTNGTDGANGAQGPQGPQGLQGPAGSISSVTIVTAVSLSNSLSTRTVSVSCAGSAKVLGGGHYLSDAAGVLVVTRSYPSAAGTWTVSAAESKSFPGNWTVTAYALCA